MKGRRRILNRRNFCAATGSAGVGAAWLTLSNSFTARFVRERFSEVGRPVPKPSHQPHPEKWNDNSLTIAWLGHSTVLINFYGLRILTDPVLFPRVGVGAVVGTLGPKRLVACALDPRELPEIDLVLVSHAHFDHLDIPSLAVVRGHPAAIMAAETGDLMPRKYYSSVRELRWGDSSRIKTARGDALIRAIEVRHWGARIRRDTQRGYNGYIVEREGRKIIFGGDTADTGLFSDYRRYGPFDAAIMPIGAYNPWIRSHCTPEQAVAMADAAGSRYFIPIHHQCFKLSNEPFLEPLERVAAAFAHEPERLALREVGESVVLPI